MNPGLQTRLKSCLSLVARRAGRAHVAGPDLADGINACLSFAGRGFGTSLGFWNRGGEPARPIVDTYLAALDTISERKLDCALSIKAPALGYSREMLAEILRRAAKHRIAVQFDSLGPDTAETTFSLLRELSSPLLAHSCTLPGRWRRSVRDVDFALERHLGVRVVKGQWPDPDHPNLNPRSGFLAVVDRLAGRAPCVKIATHDAPLGIEAVRRLIAARTPCEWELLLGLPLRSPAYAARRAGVPVRIYVPYGHAHLPYRPRDGLWNPRVGSWLMSDILRGSRRPVI